MAFQISVVAPQRDVKSPGKGQGVGVVRISIAKTLPSPWEMFGIDVERMRPYREKTPPHLD